MKLVIYPEDWHPKLYAEVMSVYEQIQTRNTGGKIRLPHGRVAYRINSDHVQILLGNGDLLYGFMYDRNSDECLVYTSDHLRSGAYPYGSDIPELGLDA